MPHADSSAAADAPSGSEDSEAKDGMRRSPSRRPSTKTATTTAASRISLALALPPRRKKHPRFAQGASLSTSSSTECSDSDIRRSASASSGDEVGTRDVCERCRRSRQHLAKLATTKTATTTVVSCVSSTECCGESRRVMRDSSASEGTSRSAAAAASRRSRVSQRSHSQHGAPHSKKNTHRQFPVRQKPSFAGSRTTVNRHASDTSTTASSPSTSSSSLSTERTSEEELEEGEDSEASSGEGSTATANEVLSSSSTATTPLCTLTDVLPRDLYLHICSFLDVVDCCTLLEVSLHMHAAITCADGYVWRRLCMTTWQHKQGFQTFIQRVRALEGLGRREELEVQALQQHMLLLREQDTFFGESDVSTTCDDATVLIRRRQHEQAQWMAASMAPSSGGVGGGGGLVAVSASAKAALATTGLGRARYTLNHTEVGSSITTDSSETPSSSEDEDTRREASSSRRRRERERRGRRRSSKKSTHRSSTTAATSATASTSRRSARRLLRTKQTAAAAAAARSASTPSQDDKRIWGCPSVETATPRRRRHHHRHHRRRTSSEAGSTDSAETAAHQYSQGTLVDNASVARQQSPCPADDKTTGEERFDETDKAAVGAATMATVEGDDGRRKDRRVRIRLPEDADSDGKASFAASHERSCGASSMVSPRKQNRRHHHHHHRHQSDPSKRQQQQQRQSSAPPPISRHRRSHSIKKRKPAKQRRRKRGRSRRPRATGGGGGRHRSQHHRSQSRHHRAARQHHHNPKVTKSTRRRRRRQRNAAAAAAAAASGGTGEGSRPTPSLGAGPGSSSAAGSASHGSPYFYQTPTYEAIKSTTPVLSMQHVAPTLVPFQLGGRPGALQSSATAAAATETGASLSSPVAGGGGIPRFPSRDIDVHGVHQAHASTGPSVPHTIASSTGNAASNDARAGTANADAALAPVTAANLADLNEEDGLYWWQLTPEARQRQLRRMQQQQSRTAMATAAAGVRPPHTSSDGEEIANEAALQEWDALEASFSSSAAAATEDDADDDIMHDDDESQRSTLDPSSNASAATATPATTVVTGASASGSSSSTQASAVETRRSRVMSSRVCSHARHHRPSLTTSSRSHTSPSSLCTSRSSPSCSEDDDDDEGTSAEDVSYGKPDSDTSHTDGEERVDDDDECRETATRSRHRHGGDSSSGSDSDSHHRAHHVASRSAASTSSSRLSARVERQLVKALAKRYEAIEEAMIITRSKSVLIHTLERQTSAHLPRLLAAAAAAAQRQRRMMLAGRVAAAAHGAGGAVAGMHVGPARPHSPGNVGTASTAAPAATSSTSGAESNINAHPYETASVARPVLLLGNERSPAAAASPPTAAGGSTLPSSLSNAFPTSPGVALAVPASPLLQLARISSSTTLADGAARHTPSTIVDTACGSDGGGSGVGAEANAQRDSSEVSADNCSLLRGDADAFESGHHHHHHAHARNDEVDSEFDDEEEPLAPVSWKFAYFMSRREARRATITLQDLLEGMWLACFRSTGRTHPIRFSRQMQVLMYPPLKTPEEEEEEESGDAAEDAATRVQQRTALASGRAGSRGPNNRVATTATALPSTAAAPSLPFHLLQGGAQLVVHQFPPMKVLRRSAFSVHDAPARHASTTATTATATAAAEAERRFVAEPQATLRRLRLCMMRATNDPAASDEAQPNRGYDLRHGGGSHGIDEGLRAWRGSRDAADVTQTNVRRFIAQQLGLSAAYVADALGPVPAKDGVATTTAAAAAASTQDGEKEPRDEETSAEDRLLHVRQRDESRRTGKGLKRHTFCGPMTREEFEAQQRLEACFAPGGLADVFNDWGWTIAGHHVKIFSVDVTAPLYVERLQRIVDVEVIGRSHDGARAAKHV